MKMNKLFRLMSGTAAAAVIFGGGALLANAADPDAAPSTGEATFLEGEFDWDREVDEETGDLVPVVPALRFVGQIGDDESVEAVSGGQLRINDFRGSDGTWRVEVSQRSEFTNRLTGDDLISLGSATAMVIALDAPIGSGTNVAPLSFKLTPPVENNDGEIEYNTQLALDVIGGFGSTVASVNLNDTTLSGIEWENGVNTEDTYTAELLWTLAAVPSPLFE